MCAAGDGAACLAAEARKHTWCNGAQKGVRAPPWKSQLVLQRDDEFPWTVSGVSHQMSTRWLSANREMEIFYPRGLLVYSLFIISY